MAESTTNNSANVSTSKGVRGGYIFVAPTGTALPTDFKTKLNASFKNLGYISEDGYTESVETDSEEKKDLNGDLIDTVQTSRVESGQFTLAEIKAMTLKIMYGDSNVTDANGVITVKHNGDDATTWSVVLDLVLKNNRRWRKVVPMAQASELDDLTISVSELASRAVTMKYLADAAGNTCYDYFESTETAAAGASTAKN